MTPFTKWRAWLVEIKTVIILYNRSKIQCLVLFFKGRKLFSDNLFEIKNATRLHSSRMHTTRSLTISPSMLCSGGGAWSWGLPGPGGDTCLVRGVPGPGGGGIPACTEADPHVNKITDACENITLPQLRCGR